VVCGTVSVITSVGVMTVGLGVGVGGVTMT